MAVFGENARHIPREMLMKGAIIDCRAAEILSERGIDVGIREFGDEAQYMQEYFPPFDEQIGFVYDPITARQLALDPAAEIQSQFVRSDPFMYVRRDPIPAAFTYKNQDGEHFLVFSFAADQKSDAMNRSYARSRQLSDCIEKISGRRLPAYVYGNPDMYILAKKSETGMAVGLFNIFADTALAPAVELDEEYSSVSFISCSGRLEGKRVYLENIPPFSFAGIVLGK